ncbi:MAG: citramalate synthase [Alphaproteobacteria bacterium]|nr:citramalate synthase [Alphaproteobacteria bacterium]
MVTDRLYLFDTTLRDGAQTAGVDFSVADKQAIAAALDRLGIDYIEGGWPGANPTDDRFFADDPGFSKATFTAFGMTKRPGRSAANDPGLSALFNSTARALCLVGKTWDFHVDVALGVPRDDNVASIGDSIAEAVRRKGEALFDAEHFFDGYKANPDYALACVTAAYQAGARWVVLCDTNGGTLPHEIEEIVGAVTRHVPGDRLGIHAHDDTGNAIANSLAAVRAGVRQVQGTIGGLGERCGNANLISLIPTLVLKLGYQTGVSAEGLASLTHLSRWFDDLLNRPPSRNTPYVGTGAFTHKGGLHASAVAKDPASYEHVPPEAVGNRRHVVVSDQAGKSNILARFAELGIEVDPKHPNVDKLVRLVKQREFDGYAYDGAEASFEMLARRMLGQVPEYFRLERFSVVDERRFNARGQLVTESEATVKVRVGNALRHEVADGNSPVNAIDRALRKALEPAYPVLTRMKLVDFRVRILKATEASGAMPRVLIESANGQGRRWSTVGVSTNIIDASFDALGDSFAYKLFHNGVDTAA